MFVNFKKTVMAEHNWYRLWTPRELDWELFLARNLITRLGWETWEHYQNSLQESLMEIFDSFTLHMDYNGAGQVELEARRLLLVQLNIQHSEFMASIFHLHYNDLNK